MGGAADVVSCILKLIINFIINFIRGPMRSLLFPFRSFALLLACSFAAAAQEKPYFVPYSHDLEEPGNLEIKYTHNTGAPDSGNRFFNHFMELEYGVKAWWTTELYLEGQSTQRDSTVFTGFRIENRFRPLMREHWINPVLYVEFENINGANRTLREIVGHDGQADYTGPNALARAEKKREVELRLILSSNFKGWNLSENIIAEKNLSNEPWEFGYAIGLSRPLKLAASAKPCVFCREKFAAGLELYGGLGDRYSFGLKDTSHYLGPSIRWDAPNGMSFAFSPQFGLNGRSVPRLYRFSVSYEVEQIFSRMGFLKKGSGNNGGGR